MNFYETVAGKRFFNSQLPHLITALSDIATALKNPTPMFCLEQEVPPDFLESIYLNRHDTSTLVAREAIRTYDADIIAHQGRMREILSSDAWEQVEQYKALLDAKGAVEREQAFSAGFRYATMSFVAGLSTPQSTSQKT